MIYGDVSEEDKALTTKLKNHEKSLELDKVLTKDQRAYSYVCLAHDWYAMGMEEEGHALLAKAEKACPGYFKNYMVKQTQSNPNFNLIVRNISVELMWMVVEQMRNK